MRKRVGLFGWGIVAPKSPDIEAFKKNLRDPNDWLSPFEGFGPSNFLVGLPEFSLKDYRPWVEKRFSTGRFLQLAEKMDLPTQYATGAFIQALGQNNGIEGELKELGPLAHVYVGTSYGSMSITQEQSIMLHEAQRKWDRFWTRPEVNPDLRAYLAMSLDERAHATDIPRDPQSVPPAEIDVAEGAWCHYWAKRSLGLREYLKELADIEAQDVEGSIETAKRRALANRERLYAKLQQKYGAPDPPWRISAAGMLWNLHNAPAAQISILGKITGLSFAPVAACSTFGVALKLAMTAIRSEEARAVVVGATDLPPQALGLAAFYNARLLSADGTVSVPLTALRGTHVSGGAVVWIVADYDYMRSRGFKPLGMEILAVGVSSNADDLITPSFEGPKIAIQQALAEACVNPDQIGTWDLHATGTPGDYLELTTLRSIFPDSLLVTARKGTFGHGMSASTGWELTAQYVSNERARIFPTALRRERLNSSIGNVHRQFVFEKDLSIPGGLAGKLSMGVGGINACVISRPWDFDALNRS